MSKCRYSYVLYQHVGGRVEVARIKECNKKLKYVICDIIDKYGVKVKKLLKEIDTKFFYSKQDAVNYIVHLRANGIVGI